MSGDLAGFRKGRSRKSGVWKAGCGPPSRGHRGLTLGQWCAAHRQDPADAAPRLRAAADRAFALLRRWHAAGWHHGDLHPGNVLITAAGTGTGAHLAFEAGVEFIDHDLTHHRDLLPLRGPYRGGGDQAIAPEIARLLFTTVPDVDVELTDAAEIYSLGATLRWAWTDAGPSTPRFVGPHVTPDDSPDRGHARGHALRRVVAHSSRRRAPPAVRSGAAPAGTESRAHVLAALNRPRLAVTAALRPGIGGYTPDFMPPARRPARCARPHRRTPPDRHHTRADRRPRQATPGRQSTLTTVRRHLGCGESEFAHRAADETEAGMTP
ncbi:phosphotransferase [Embleya sp. NBC_00888]|uniref:phosphotransferase n=1 Tax=Embleya sp. NBC_00888 TaxID=2975960 RepID=UPI002F90F8FE